MRMPRSNCIIVSVQSELTGLTWELPILNEEQVVLPSCGASIDSSILGMHIFSIDLV